LRPVGHAVARTEASAGEAESGVGDVTKKTDSPSRAGKGSSGGLDSSFPPTWNQAGFSQIMPETASKRCSWRLLAIALTASRRFVALATYWRERRVRELTDGAVLAVALI